MNSYSIQFTNQTEMSVMACVFQQCSNADIMPVAFLVYLCEPNIQVNIGWEESYAYFWTRGMPIPGTQVMPTGFMEPMPPYNETKFIDMSFRPELQTGPPDTLSVVTDSSVPAEQYMVGIAIENYPTFVAQADPGTTAVFPIATPYWIAVCDFSQGDVLDPDFSQWGVKLPFPATPNIQVIYNSDGSFTINSL
jgi:hypothetical protein